MLKHPAEWPEPWRTIGFILVACAIVWALRLSGALDVAVIR